MKPATTPVPRSILFVTQVYEPDPAAVGQYLADTARMLAARGHRVTVFTAREGYEDPSRKYPAREMTGGVEVIRLRFGSLGKGSIAWRLLGGALFLAQAVTRALLRRRCDVLVVSTSPPLAPLAGWFISVVRRCRLKLWVMDLNPDQVVALGRMASTAWQVGVFDAMNRMVLRRADQVLVLDRYMAERVRAKWDPGERLSVVTLWPLPEHLQGGRVGETNEVRRELEVGSAALVMYAGNHSNANPLTTLLNAARARAADPRLAFAFVGGGVAKGEVDGYLSQRLRALPYQPLERLGETLAAADVHVVSLGPLMAGIIHPCKIYGAMAAGRPVLVLGPARSHLGDLVRDGGFGWQVDHGDVVGTLRVLDEIAGLGPDGLATLGARGRAMIDGPLERGRLITQACELLES